MFGGPPRHLLAQETSKPKRASETLARLGRYFGPWWPVLTLTVLLVVVSTWAQVTTPELSGQLVDCFLAPSEPTALSPAAAWPAREPRRPANRPIAGWPPGANRRA